MSSSFDLSSTDGVRAFRKIIYDFFCKNGRTLPWRTDYNPYHIYISEVMLQQTQVDRVIPKFSYFIDEIPSFEALASAPFSKVLSVWQGLGYNRRAQSLQKAAHVITTDYNGILPDDPEKLVLLPGIGKATAASITAFAFNKPTLFLETNIRTVYIHHFFGDEQTVPDEKLLALAQSALDMKNPRKWYSALMDYGSHLKKEFGNATRKSKEYKKQSSFIGSRRQLRGKVLKLLLDNKKHKPDDILEYLGTEQERCTEVLSLLLKENLVNYENGRYFI